MNEEEIIDKVKNNSEINAHLEMLSKIQTLQYFLIKNNIAKLDEIEKINKYFLEENKKCMIDLIPERLNAKFQKKDE